MIGHGLLLECLDHPKIESILTLNRSQLQITHPKLKAIICRNFFNLTEIKQELEGFDTCFFCLGISSGGRTEREYTSITYELTLSFARNILAINPDITFCYISGAGTDSAESSRMMWARIKGKTENDLLKLPFSSVYMFRPGFILPKKGVRSRTKAYQIIYTLARPFYPVLRKIPRYVTSSDRLGKAMIRVGMEGYLKNILETSDINSLTNQ